MQGGVLTVMVADESLPDALESLVGAGISAVELGCGDDHLPRDEYLNDGSVQAGLAALLDQHDLVVSAREGLEEAVDVLDRAVFETHPDEAYH